MKTLKELWYELRGSPTKKWMICLYALGCKGMKPHPMLCNFRWGEPHNYDFFSLFGPYESEAEAQSECDRIIKAVEEKKEKQ